MKKHFLKLFVLFMLFFSPLVVEASFGDLRYDITEVNIRGSEIIFKGWAFIHRTNNSSNNDQKISIRAVSSSGQVIESKIVNGTNEINYNFYCELFEKTGLSCISDNYENSDVNKCENDKYGNTLVSNDKASQCYYEDMYFEIKFDVLGWPEDNVKFQIAVSNNDYEYKKGHLGGTDLFTNYEDLYISSSVLPGTVSNDYIEVDSTSVSSSVVFIASHGLLRKAGDISFGFAYTKASVDKKGGDYNCSYGEWNGGSNSYLLSSIGNYSGGRSTEPETGRCKDFLNINGKECKGTHNYAIKVSKTGKFYEDGYCYIAPSCIEEDCSTAIARGSHIKLTGTTSFRIKVKNKKLCAINNSLPESLNCNSNGSFSSTCGELTIDTSEGRAVVKIEQTGTLSNVMSPTKLFAGGGFNYGILYYNTVVWDYVPGQNISGELNKKVIEQMKIRIKNVDEYVPSIDIDFKIGGKSVSLIKQCTSSENFEAGKKSVVSCLFTLPEPILNLDGSVNYNWDVSKLDINNKYYSPLNYDGAYNIIASIDNTDLNRIDVEQAKEDTVENIGNVPWTGYWNVDSLKCVIDIYPLLYNSEGKYKFIYRPIDINNPFPNRNAGINWYDWINSTIPNNKERLKNTYSDTQEYTAIINNSTMTGIKEYNKNYNYLDWNNMVNDSFINKYDYVKRGAGS